MPKTHRKTFAPTAHRVSEAVSKTCGGVVKHNSDAGNAGFRVTQWVEDEYGNPTVKIEWFMGSDPDVGPGRKYESRIQAARRTKLREILSELVEEGYNVVWGWDPETGDPDTNFIVVISPESAEKDANGELPDALEDVMEAEGGQAEQDFDEDRLRQLVITEKDAQEAVMAITRAWNVGRDEQARRLEHRLMTAVLTAIVCEGPENAVDRAAVALSTQHLPFGR